MRCSGLQRLKLQSQAEMTWPRDLIDNRDVTISYVPLQVTPAIYGDYSTSTGNYQNLDAYTRNIRERSAQICTKPEFN
jgi:hypothetical protein